MPDDEDYQAGQEVGGRPDGSAIDCPFVPGVDKDRRARWLEGFASVRDETETAKVEPLPSDQQDQHSA